MQANAGNMSTGAQVAMSAVIGGTAEKLGGGKFANGAVTGAYVMMFNHLGGGQNENKQQNKKTRELIDIYSDTWPEEIMAIIKEIHQNKEQGHISEIFTSESLHFNQYTIKKDVDGVLDATSSIRMTIINPKTPPEYGYYYQIKFRGYQSFGRANFGEFTISGQHAVVSIKIFDQNVFNKYINIILK